ncbi:MAG TPA: hypothetical protein VFZ01_20575 [Geminicoccaceae bacterium]
MTVPLLTIDSATKYDERHRGAVVVCGSHGGVYPAYLSARAGLRAVVLSDAGVGRDQAGLGCLAYCETLGMAAATVAHDSARIGDGEDMLARGRVSHANRHAEASGVRRRQPVAEARRCLAAAPSWAGAPPAYREARRVVVDRPGKPRAICVDSASLVEPDDAGQILITGSHGALMGGRADLAFAVDALAAFFNDAGIGADEAGVSRLPALQARGIVGACVDTMSARIGDGLSTYEDGVVSRLNEAGRAVGGEPGMPLRDLVQRLLG